MHMPERRVRDRERKRIKRAQVDGHEPRKRVREVLPPRKGIFRPLRPLVVLGLRGATALAFPVPNPPLRRRHTFGRLHLSRNGVRALAVVRLLSCVSWLSSRSVLGSATSASTAVYAAASCGDDVHATSPDRGTPPPVWHQGAGTSPG